MASLILMKSSWSNPVTPKGLPELPEGPLLLTSVKPEQLSASYWLERLPEVDRPLKTPEELQAFNAEINEMIPERVNVFKFATLEAGAWVKKQLKLEYDTVKGRKLFGANDKPVQKAFFETQMKPLMQWQSVPKSIQIKWAVAIKATSVRALPTPKLMVEDIGDYEFDMLQFTLVKMWTPLVVLHTSSDQKWLYVQAPYVRGWVQAKDISFFKTKALLKTYTKPDSFLVITGESEQVYLDAAFKEPYLKPSMGTVLPLINQQDNGFEVWLPLRQASGDTLLRKGYLSPGSDVSIGFLPFTQRNIITQAFKLLGERYGWGGMYKGRDCSGFTHDVFLSLGVDMPRDSKQQGFVGTQLGHFEPFKQTEAKKRALRAGLPGITMLRMPLHLMLYLGEVDGQFYIIHSTWAERVSMDSDVKVRINQVVVSDLTLNGNSYLGSLFDRTVSINELN